MSGTVLDLLRKATSYLEGKAVESARLDAELLLGDVLGLDRVGVYCNFDRPLNPDETAAYREAVRRRGRREPLSYIRGVQEFWSRPFRVDSSVLVPRPETETLVEAALAMGSAGPPARVLDVGTGSGALAVTLALEIPDSVVTATDVSDEALRVAAGNARRLVDGNRVRCLKGDLFAPVDGERFDLIVTNPPYVATADWEGLEPEVRDFEPRLALDGGADGLDVVGRLLDGARSRLAPGGALLVEVGYGQAAAVAGMGRDAGLEVDGLSSDLAGVERVVAFREGGR